MAQIGTITALERQVRDSERFNVFIDGEFAVGVSLRTVADEGLYVGKPIDAAAWDRLVGCEERDRALQAALRLLEVRPRSTAELRERLRRKQIASPAIEAALERLTTLGLLDDAAFARFWVENRLTYRPRGTRALRTELRQKGVDPAIIGTTLDEVGQLEAESARALELAQQVLQRYAAAPDYQTFARRLGGYLLRRGFAYPTIKPIVTRLWADAGLAQADPDVDFEQGESDA